MLLLIGFIYSSLLQTNPSFSLQSRFIYVVPIIHSNIIVMIGNDETGQYLFPKVLQTGEGPHQSAKRAGYEEAGVIGDVTNNPFYVEGNASYYVMDVDREDPGWDEKYKSRKHVTLVEVEGDTGISDHDKYIIGECNLQGYIVF